MLVLRCSATVGRDKISRRYTSDLLRNKGEQEGKEQVAVYSKSGAFPRQEFHCVMHRFLSLFASLLQLTKSVQLATAADFKPNYSHFYLVTQPQFCSPFSSINASRIGRTCYSWQSSV